LLSNQFVFAEPFLRATSPPYKLRLAEPLPCRAIGRKLWFQSVRNKLADKGFKCFLELTMQDSNQFHATCLDTYPPIFYMNDVSRSIVRILPTYNHKADSARAAYTFDAGPNAVVYCLEENFVEIRLW
jgi:mevalonate pyrophosphate decarboxylase